MLAEHEVAAHHGCDENDGNSQTLDDGSDQCVVNGDPHLSAIKLFRRQLELTALDRLHRESFDKLDSAERFGKRFVDHRKLLHCLAMRALERFAEPVNRVTGKGSDQEREQQQPPTDPGGDREADNDFEWLEQDLAKQALHSPPTELRSVVQRFMRSPRPASVKLAISSRSTCE